jgi:hypothetical protein
MSFSFGLRANSLTAAMFVVRFLCTVNRNCLQDRRRRCRSEGSRDSRKIQHARYVVASVCESLVDTGSGIGLRSHFFWVFLALENWHCESEIKWLATEELNNKETEISEVTFSALQSYPRCQSLHSRLQVHIQGHGDQESVCV